MKRILASIAVSCAVSMSTTVWAAGDMAGMDMSGGAAHGAAHGADEAPDAMSHGQIKKIDSAAGKLTIKHGPLKNLGMDGMTMVFKVKDPAMLSQVAVGDTIDFVAEDVNGSLTVVKLHKQ